MRFEGQKLVARGFFVDTLPEAWSSSTTTTTIFEEDTAKGNINPYGDEEAIREAIWRTPVTDSDLDKGKSRAPVCYGKLLDFPRDILDPKSLDDYTGAFYDMRKEYLDFPVCGKRFADYFPASAEPTEELEIEKEALWPLKNKEDLDPFHQSRFMMSTRKLEVTEKGYLGLVRMEVKKGDLVTIFLGVGLLLF